MSYDTTPIQEFDPERSILFLGSGFSLGATNIANDSPPNGKGLRRHFIKQLKLPEDTLTTICKSSATSLPTAMPKSFATNSTGFFG